MKDVLKTHQAVFSETWFSKQTFVLVGIGRDKGIGATAVAFHGFGGINTGNGYQDL